MSLKVILEILEAAPGVIGTVNRTLKAVEAATTTQDKVKACVQGVEEILEVLKNAL